MPLRVQQESVSKMKIAKLVIVGLCIGALSGCGPQRGEGVGSLNPFSELHENFEGTYLDARTQPGKWTPPEEVNWAEKDIELQAGETKPVPSGNVLVSTIYHGALPLKRKELYLTRLLDKLAAQSPVSDIDYRVRIVGDGYYGRAQAMPDGTIVVPLAFLINAESEDEVAWLLAHELSHLILQHHDIDWIKGFQAGIAGMARNAVRGAELASLQLQQMSNGRANMPVKQVARVHGVADTLFQTTAGGVFPAWQRSQEDEADLLGTDLMAKAGYNPEVGVTVIYKIGKAANEQALREKRQRQAQEKAKKELEDLQMAWSIDGTVDFFGNRLEDLWRGFRSEAKRVHRESVKRKANLEDYLETRYAEIDRDNNTRAWRRAWEGTAAARMAKSYSDVWKTEELLLQNNIGAAEESIRRAMAGGLSGHGQARLAFYRVRLRQGKLALARKNLEIALAPGALSSLGVYREYANLLITDGKSGKAEQIIDRAWDRYQAPAQLYPLRIQLAMLNGESGRAIGLVSECNKRAYALADDCEDALQPSDAMQSTAAGSR